MFVDGFVAAVPNANKDAYIHHARTMGAIFREHGALRIVECWGADVPDGKLTSFPLAVKKEADETVVFSWVTWPDKSSRDAGWAKIMADPRMAPGAVAMPFDGKRMIYGGFDVLLEL